MTKLKPACLIMLFVYFVHPFWLSSQTLVRFCLCYRGYEGAKLSNNIECEIFQILLEEAQENYEESIVVALRSDTVEDVARNVEALTDWVRNWQPVR